MKASQSFNLLFTATFCSAASFVFSQSILSDLPEEEFNGKVRSIIETTLDFNEHGDTTNTWRVVKKLDEQKRLISLLRTIDGDTIAHMQFRFDDHGNRLQTFPEQAVQTQFTYNDAGLMIEKREFMRDGSPYRSTSYQFDERKQLIYVCEFNKEGTKKNEQRFRYNQQGKVVEESLSNEGGTYSQSLYHYDSVGTLIETVVFNQFENDDFRKTCYTNGENGKWNEALVLNQEGQMQRIMSIERDEFGNIVCFKSFQTTDQSTEENTFAYRYDEIGNWIEEKCYSDGLLYAVNTRIITYE